MAVSFLGKDFGLNFQYLNLRIHSVLLCSCLQKLLYSYSCFNILVATKFYKYLNCIAIIGNFYIARIYPYSVSSDYCVSCIYALLGVHLDLPTCGSHLLLMWSRCVHWPLELGIFIRPSLTARTYSECRSFRRIAIAIEAAWPTSAVLSSRTSTENRKRKRTPPRCRS